MTLPRLETFLNPELSSPELSFYLSFFLCGFLCVCFCFVILCLLRKCVDCTQKSIQVLIIMTAWRDEHYNKYFSYRVGGHRNGCQLILLFFKVARIISGKGHIQISFLDIGRNSLKSKVRSQQLNYHV